MELVAPPWFDGEKFEKGRKFSVENFGSILLGWYSSLLIGFAVPSLGEALVFTGISSTPETSRRRYMDTGQYIGPYSQTFVNI